MIEIGQRYDWYGTPVTVVRYFAVKAWTVRDDTGKGFAVNEAELLQRERLQGQDQDKIKATDVPKNDTRED